MNARQEIIGYIESKEVNGALLLTGKWGFGKSYIVNDICQAMNDNRKKRFITESCGIDKKEVEKELCDDASYFGHLPNS